MVLGGQIVMNEKAIIKRIIKIIQQDGEDATDGECISQIMELLQWNGYEVFNIENREGRNGQ